MAVPKFEEMYIPLLECLKDGKEHTSKEVNDLIAKYMNISDEDVIELLPSGNMEIFHSRANWARTYLKKAGLIESPRRGIFLISDEGKRLLLESPEEIGLNLFLKNETFHEFYMGKKPTKDETSIDSSSIIEGTPQDSLEEAIQKINAGLADELLTEIMNMPPLFFERLVVKLLEKMGYGGSLKNAGEVTGKSGDEGIDGIVREDKLGFDLIYIQAKRWDLETTIGRPEIQKFVGALAGQGATKGLFITTAKFSREAIDYVKKQHTTKVVLVDGQLLPKLMIEHNLGVSVENIYEIKRIDSDFFSN
jgi:Restriction endonuclease